MKAMLVADDQCFNWADVPEPVLTDDAVLIDISCAAVNRADLLQRQGLYPPPPGAPEWMGLEVSGTITAMGDAVASAGSWNIGDQICALLPGGAYAERVVCDARLLMPIPAGLNSEEAASLPEVFATAYVNLFMEADLQADEWVFIHAGASGVGIAAIQLAKMAGAHVVTTVSGSEKAAAVKALGADIVIDRSRDDIAVVMQRCAEEGHPMNVVLDCVGGENLGSLLEHMALGGRWVLIGTLAGPETQLPLRVVLKRGLRIIGSTLRGRSLAQKHAILQALCERVWPEITAGRIKPMLHAVHAIKDVDAAHRVLEDCANIGKVVLRIAAS